MKEKIYVGLSAGVRPRVFLSMVEPTQDTHGVYYGAVIGPFRTRRAAEFMAATYPNPHIQHVSDAERISKKYVIR